MPQERRAEQAQGAETAKPETKEVKKLPSFLVKSDIEKEALKEIIEAGKSAFIEKLPEGYARKLGASLVDDLEGKLKKSMGE